MKEKKRFECAELQRAYDAAMRRVESMDEVDGYSVGQLETVTALNTVIAALEAGIVRSQILEEFVFDALFMLVQLRDDRQSKGIN